MNPTIKYPFYVKLAFVLLIMSILLAFIYVGQEILIPIILALLIAILLRPVVHFLNKKLKFPHVIAVIVSVILFILFIAGILFFVSWKIGDMAQDWENIKNNFLLHYHNIQRWIVQRFNVSYWDQNQYVKQATKDSLSGKVLFSKNTLNSFTDVLLNFTLIPIYTFLFLIYRNLFIKFLSKLFKEEDQIILQEILINVKVSIQRYLVGLLIQMGIVATLTSIGLMILGVEYAILLGVITGLLNLIPYIGILIAGSLSIIVSLTGSTQVSVVLGVIIVTIIVQFIDNNIVVPMIVSSKVKINALISIIAIIIGAALAGIAGMFLAIPVIAIIKVIFDRVDSLEPWGFLMGDDLPKTYEWGKIKLPALDAGNNKNGASHKKDENDTTTDKTQFK